MPLKKRDLTLTLASTMVGLTLGVSGLALAQSPSFRDLPADHWAAKAVHYLAERNIIKGYEDQTFQPNKPVTRAEFAQGLYQAKTAPNIVQAPLTEWNQDLPSPRIDPEAYVSQGATVTGDVTVEKNVFVAPSASVRGDEGRPIVIKEGSNIQDGAVIHGLENSKNAANRYPGPDGKEHSVYVGRNVSVAHGALVHGPAIVDDDTFLGFNAIVLKAKVGKGVFVGHGAMVIGVTVVDNKFVPNGAVIDTQEKADALQEKTRANEEFAAEVIHVNQAFARGYRDQPAGQQPGHTAH